MFHSEVSLDEVCGGLIDSDPALKCRSRSTVLVRIVPGTDRLALLLCALWRGLIQSAIPSLLTFSFVGQGRTGERERGRVVGYWIQASLLTKHFQQVETCFWISNSPNPSSPSLAAFCCPPLALPLFILSLCLISISAGLISLCSG